MLRLLTDSHLSPEIALAARKLASLNITPLRDWKNGINLHKKDSELLFLAAEEELTIVTFDVNTFPLGIKAHLESGHNHAGVIFISSTRFPQNHFGKISRALVELWNLHRHDDWTNRIHFLH